MRLLDLYCGAGHQLRRHRLFEIGGFEVPAIPPCDHKQPVIGVYGGHVRQRGARHGGRGTRDFVGHDKPALAQEAIGINWPMTMTELSEAIPPAFTAFIGVRLAAQLKQRRAA